MFKHFISIVREDLASYKGDWLRPGFQALAFHRFGNWAKTIKHKPLRAPFVVASKAMFIFARNFYGIELPISTKIGRRVMIEHQGGIVVHGNSVIGDECVLRQGVTLGIKDMRDLDSAPVLGAGVNVGAGAVILGKVKIGHGSWIGANAVVIKDIPPMSTAAGVPARVLSVNGMSFPRAVASGVAAHRQRN